MRHRCCGAEVIYFVFSSEMENRTLSQMCGRLYLAIFLFRVGLLILIYIASFMALAVLCSSLPIILKLSTAIVFWCSMIGDGAFKFFLYCSSNVLTDSPIYSSSHLNLKHCGTENSIAAKHLTKMATQNRSRTPQYGGDQFIQHSLSRTQEILLPHGPNFTVASKTTPTRNT